jgi:hypothetical protein
MNKLGLVNHIYVYTVQYSHRNIHTRRHHEVGCHVVYGGGTRCGIRLHVFRLMEIRLIEDVTIGDCEVEVGVGIVKVLYISYISKIKTSQNRTIYIRIILSSRAITGWKLNCSIMETWCPVSTSSLPSSHSSFHVVWGSILCLNKMSCSYNETVVSFHNARCVLFSAAAAAGRTISTGSGVLMSL